MITFKGGWSKLYYNNTTLLVRLKMPFFFSPVIGKAKFGFIPLQGKKI